jgi:hypothetical protein
LRRFTTVILNLLATLMPTTPRNTALLPTFEAATAPFETLTFEEAVQRAITVQLLRPDIFDSLWREAQTKMI